MREKVRLGIVGPGIIWHNVHKGIIKKLSKHYQVAAFSSRSANSREKAASEFPGSKTFDDYKKLIKSDDVDALVVLTPIMLNAPVTIAALKAGKDVYVEKPMAVSIRDADKIVELEKSTGKQVFVLEQIVYSRAWNKLKEVMRSGEIGKPVMYDKLSHGLLAAGADEWGYGDTKWRINAEFPLGALFDGGIHAIALLAHFFGAPESVYARGQSLRKGYGEYDNINMIFDYKNGLQGIFSFSAFLGGKRNYFHIRGTQGLVVLDDRKLTFEYKNGRSRTFDPKEGPENNPHFNMWKKITKARLTGKPPLYTSEMARRDVYTLLCVEKSIKADKKVFL